MTEEQQRIAIAETCEFINVRMWGESCIASIGMNAEGKYWGSIGIPDYLNDLNAMHEAEKTLSQKDKREYAYQLNGGYYTSGLDDTFDIVHATAAQRAEAFLKTIDKWIQ